MIKVLIVEDDVEKLSDVRALILERTLSGSVIDSASDIKTAKKLLTSQIYDLLILDVYLPLEPQGPPKLAGVGLLEEISCSHTLKKPKFIVGLTAFDEVCETATPSFQESLWWLIRYDRGTVAWREMLKNKIDYLQALADSSSATVAKGNFDCDIAWVTALHSPELQMVKCLGGMDWKSESIAGDSTEYLRGDIPASPNPLRTVAASCHQMGMPATTLLCSKLIYHYRPRFLVMTGIAAGIRGKSQYGDILVAEHSWDYNSGKLATGTDGADYFKPDPKVIELNPALREHFIRLAASRKYLDEIRALWKGPKPNSCLEVHVGPVVSGSAVIASEALLAKVAAQSRKVVGIEMETYALFYAASNVPKPRPVPLSLKGVCDFADLTKDDTYQSYAAFTSAEYFFRIAKYELSSLLHAI